ncbi:EF-hand calcium-binding domain-containing protein 5 [Microcaecilia unicolor]|uniref:EF-hand calcium-binding domain-containing protein 5 n=1 Tax=Microcaecilia unicolor TaxID=1415580 RepID=A0A6P7WUK2_9AMPH|nr:EF-hand calcium-binding domain-containing protein 5 [Microcaecilia unicolor]
MAAHSIAAHFECCIEATREIYTGDYNEELRMAYHQGETEQALKAHNNRNNTAMTEDRVFTQQQDSLWKRAFFEKVQQRGLNLQQNSMEKMNLQKVKEQKIEKEDPPDLLTKDWLNEDKLTVDTRVYLLEKLMPTVISGIEHLLTEVEKRKLLEEDGGQSKFNPLNFLGQYLMRNNPQFYYCSQPCSYVRGMQQVTQGLKSQTQKVKLSRLTQLKAEIKETQELREEAEKVATELRNKKKEALGLHFQDWTLDVTGRIPLPLVQSALKSFQDVVSQYLPGSRQVIYARELEMTTKWEQKLNEEEFVEFLYSYVKELSTEMLEEFLSHLSQCADGFHETVQRDMWRKMFSNVFQACDSVKMGFLDRQRILALLENFYDSSSKDADGWRFRDPRQWPVIELEERNRADISAQFDDGRKAVTQEGMSGLDAIDSDKNVPPVQQSLEEQQSTEDTEILEHDSASRSKIDSVQGMDGTVWSDTEILEHDSASRSKIDSVQGMDGTVWSDTEILEHDASRSKIDSVQGMDGTVWSGDLLTSDLALKYTSYGQKNQDEWNIITSKFRDLQPFITDLDSQGPSRAASAFNRSMVNLPQFLQLMESFVGERASLPAVEKLVTYIKSNYEETAEERHYHQEKVQNTTLLARRKLVLAALFQKLDNEGSGSVDLNELEAQLLKYKEGAEKDAIMKGRNDLTFPLGQSEGLRLSAKTFQNYIESIIKELPGNKELVFEKLVEYLTSTTEQSQTECLRGSARRKWLQQILQAAENSAGNLEPVYRAVFHALSKDAEAHGNNKRISASIALLEKDPQEDEKAEVWLRYVACTSEDAPYVLNKILRRDMQGLSFTAVDEGKPIHAPRVQYHGNIHFWNTERLAEERKGSLLVLPLQDAINRTFGTLSIDTMRDPQERNIFLTHEISFYQGVCNVFSTAYHHVRNRQNILQLVASALAWICNRAPNIHTVTTYMMEPGLEKTDDYILRKMMTTDNNTGMSEIHPTPATLHRKDNLFRDYLFKCADSSEAITTDAYGERHIVVPLRELMGRALGVIDISTGQCRELPAHEMLDLQKMLQMLQGACSGILEESSGETQRTFVLEAEHIGENKRVGLLFHRFMLQDLRECVQKLDLQSFAELKSYKQPPALVHDILKAVLLLFCPQWAGTSEIESWSQCKLKVNSELIRNISYFDPTARSVDTQPELVAQYIKGIQRGEVWKHGSIPAEYLYNWTFTCLSLMELTAQLQGAQQTSLIALPPTSTPLEKEQTDSNGDLPSY